jgi:hypothetical protein
MVGYDDDENLYVGRDGDVYKRDDDGDWFKHDGGDDWDKIDDDKVAKARQDVENKAADRQTNLQERSDQRTQSAAAAGSSLSAEQRASVENRAANRQADPRQRAQQRQSAADLTGGRFSVEDSAARLQSSGQLQQRGSGDVIGGLERDAQARNRGTARTQQRQTWQSSNSNRTRSSRSYSSRGSYGGGGMRRGGFRRR